MTEVAHGKVSNNCSETAAMKSESEFWIPQAPRPTSKKVPDKIMFIVNKKNFG